MKDCRISSSMATGTRLLLLVSMRSHCGPAALGRRSAGAVLSATPPSAPAERRPPEPDRALDVQILHAQRVVLDEAAPRLDLVAHQRREDLVGLVGVLDTDLEQR